MKKNTSSDSIPLLLCGTFFNEQPDFSINKILRLIEEGNIFCTSDIKNEIKSSFNLSNAPKTILINHIDFQSDTFLLITTLDSLDPRLQVKMIGGINFFKTPENYKFWIPTESKKFNFKKEITSYTHTGVTAITRATGKLLDNLSIDMYLKNLYPYFKNRDYVHVSNEVSIEENCNYAAMKLKFATKKSHFEILNKINANIIELTGNHNLDVGTVPYLNSLKWYQKNNKQYFGGGANESEASKPLIIELKDGKKFAWIGFNELCPCGECTDNLPHKMGASRYSFGKAKNTIKKLKNDNKVDCIITCVQFGERDSYEPSPSQEKICKDLIDLGSDVVLGSQAHQPQTLEIYKGKLIFYGLGNFLFDQIHRVGVRQAFFLECYFYKGKIIQFQPVFTYLPNSRIPNIASKEEEKEIRRAIFLKKNFRK
ncbi:MAG: CapA family protein [Bacteroidota bacterium]